MFTKPRGLTTTLALSLLFSSATISAMSFTFSRITGTVPVFSADSVPSFTTGGIASQGTSSGSGNTGIYSASGGATQSVAQTNGGSIGRPSGGRGAFRASNRSGRPAIYTPVGGSLSTIVPDTSRFSSVGDPDDNDNVVASRGTDDAGEGIYTDADTATDTITTVADEDTVVPGGRNGETFDSFGETVALDDGLTAFTGTGNAGTNGIYTGLNGIIEKVIDLNDELEGETLSSLVLGRNGVNNGSFTFLAGFDQDQHFAIFRADPLDQGFSPQGVPVPATLVLFLIGITALGAKRRSGNPMSA